MSELKLVNPKEIHEASPTNGAGGTQSVLSPDFSTGIPEVMPEMVQAVLGQVRLIDVRRPDEFNGELGHVAGSELVTLGGELAAFLENCDRAQEIIFVCRSGARSAQATSYCVEMGFKAVANMRGGMIRWNDLGLPVERA